MFRRLSLVVLLLVSLPAIATAGAPGSTAVAPESTAASASIAASDASAATAASDASAATAASDAGTAGGSTNSGGAAPTAAVESAGSAESIVRTVELSLTPEKPGSYDAVIRYDVPDSVTKVSVTLGSESTVTSATGFERSGTNSYEWMGSTNEPTLRVTVDANETSAGRRSDAATVGELSTESELSTGSELATPAEVSTASNASTAEGYVFVDPGPWALVRVPRVGTSWEWNGGGTVGIEKETRVDGPGATGGEMAYMGEVTRYSATGRDERFELVVPERAELNATPEAVLGTFTAASERMRVGARSEEVTVIAAPDGVEWGVSGLQYGEDDAWVLADAPVDTVDNVWLHEYVHTRQTFTTTDSGKWITEATAEYYATLLAFDQGLGTYDAFREKLERGQRSRYDDDVLAAPQTWSDGANYLKGSLAAAAVDYRIRQRTDKSANFQNVFRDLNAYNGTVSNAVFLDSVERTADVNAREYASTLTQSDETARLWTESEHAEYFGALPAVFEYRLGDGALTASGVLGERALAGDRLALVKGETLRLALTVENVGWEAGEYAATVSVDGDVIANRTGRLASDESTTETVTRQFEETGTYAVDVAGRAVTVEVFEPAEPTVERIDAPKTAQVGSDVTFTVTYLNDARVPGRTTVKFAVDGESLADRDVSVPAESTVSQTYSVSFSEPGEHTITVGGTSVTVVVEGEEESESTTELPEGTSIPGFGASPALLALVSLVGLAVVRRTRT